MLLIWSFIFIVSLILLIKGSGWLLESSQKIGLGLGMPPFIIGMTLVAVGTSFPELVSSLAAVKLGVSDFVVANAVGSNIANILLILGIAAIVAQRLNISKALADLDLPVIAISTTIFILVSFDGYISFVEALFLVLSYVIYFGFSLRKKNILDHKKSESHKIKKRDFGMLVLGVLVLAIGSNYLVSSVIYLSSAIGIFPGVIAASFVAVGTSIPELVVSIRAAQRKQSDIVLGNVLGSNVFNLLGVVGISGLFGDLIVDSGTLTIGLSVLFFTTLLFVISAISKKIHKEEGAMFILLYIIFLAKIFNLF